MSHPEAKGPLIVSVVHGAGGGAEAALRRILTGFLATEDQPAITVVSPRGSAIHQFCIDRGLAWLEWRSRDDSATQNAKAFWHLATDRRLSSVPVFFGWGARALEWTVGLAAKHSGKAQARLADHPSAPFHGRLRRVVIRHAARRLAACVVPSRALAQACAEEGWRIPIHVIYNPIEPMPVRQGPAGDMLQVGFLGGTSLLKGIDVVAGWVRESRSLPVRWHLYGVNLSVPDAWVQRLRVEAGARVEFHERCRAEEIYRTLDIVVHPSQQFDASPNVLLEASSAGVPVVASDIGGSPEFVLQGRNGFVFPAGSPRLGFEHLAALVADPALLRNIAGEARRFAMGFVDSDATLDAYRRVWFGQSVPGAHGRSRP